MAKKKPKFGVNNYTKRTPKKDRADTINPGRKEYLDANPIGDRVGNETHNDHAVILNSFWRY